MNIISIKGLSISYADTKALDDVILDVPEGTVYGIIGPDGAGKTTLMRTICTLLPYSTGKVEVLGFDALAQSAKIRAQIGYMPQRFSLYQDLTVEQNIRFFARLFKVKSRDFKERRKKLYQFSHLEPFSQRRAGDLSGGMKQKLALSCALIHTPRLIILDEPTFGVDPISRVDFWNILREMKREGISIAISTPYMDEAEQCDLITFLHKSKVIGKGSPMQIISSWQGKLYSLTGTNLQAMYQFLSNESDIHDLQLFGNEIHLGSEKEIPAHTFKQWQRLCPSLQSWKEINPGIEDIFLKMMK